MVVLKIITMYTIISSKDFILRINRDSKAINLSSVDLDSSYWTVLDSILMRKWIYYCYQLTTFTFGSHVLQLLCLQSASTDFDLTGQLVWPGARILNNYLSNNPEIVRGCSVIELGSGIGVTGILCSRFCREVVLTDHNDEVLKILKKNIELNELSENSNSCAGLTTEKLEWGNSAQLNQILEKHTGSFDLILGADICFQQSSIPMLFNTVEQLLRFRGKDRCKLLLAYVSRAKMMDVMVVNEAIKHGLQINEIAGTRSVVASLEGLIYEITL